jgi:uracil-DNA glycosylase
MGAEAVTEECMKVLVVIESEDERKPMEELLRKAGISDFYISHIGNRKPGKIPIKKLRELKLGALDREISSFQPDYIVGSGDNAARQVLDKSVVNISRIRGRDFEYVYGTKAKKAKA